MNKIKALIASMIGAIALVFACVLGTRVNAASMMMLASDVTSTDAIQANNSYFEDKSLVDVYDSGKGATLTNITNSSYYAKTANNDKTFTSGMLASGNANVIVVKASTAVSVDIYYTIADGSFGTKDVVTKSGTLTINNNGTSTDTTISDSNQRSSLVAYVTSGTLTKDGTITLTCSGRRVVFLGVNITSDSIKTVTFNSKGGSEVTSQNVVSGKKVTAPTAPTKAGYSFVGWYTSTDGGNTLSDTAYDFDTEVSSNLTLYAKWDEVPSVNFYVDGSVYSSQVISDGTVTVPSDPSKTGYTFNGWLTEKGETFTNSGLTKTINVYADFSLNMLAPTIGEVTLTGINNVTQENKNADTIINSNITVKADSTNGVEFGNSGKTADDNTQVADYVKLKGDGSTTYRSIEVKISLRSRVTFYMVSSSSSKTAPYQISKVNGDSVSIVANGTLAASGTVSANVYTLEAGTYYLYGKRTNTSNEGNLNVYAVSIAESYYNPNVVLSVDANSDNTKVRVTAAIDNVNIVSDKVNGIESMQYTIEGKTWSKDITSVYTSVDNANSGLYRNKDYTVYAIVIFSGYNTLTTDFDVTFTVTLAGGQTVTKTITVVAPSA